MRSSRLISRCLLIGSVSLLALGLGFSVPCVAQPAEAAAPPKTEEPKLSDTDLTQAIYTYEVGGRRDPFRSLLIRNPNADRGPRPAGPAGMLVDELELQGTIRIKSGWVAMMRGTDNRAYLLKKGNTVFDGEVIDITGNDITFRQNVNDPTNPKPFRDVVKSLSLQKVTP
ncbi:MAG: hypothetical protein ABIT01_17995 [Thermoanaerobaculia bacterium]